MTTPAARAPQQVVERFFQFSLLGMLASGYFAVLGSGYLDWPTAILTLAALCLRALMVAGVVKFEVPGRVVAALTLLYIGFYPIDYFYISEGFLPAAVHLIFFLGAVKILTAKTSRDFTFVKAIAVMALLAAAVLSVSLAFFAFLTVFLLFTIATLSSGEVVRSTRLFISSGETRRALSRSGLRAFPRRLGMLSFGLFGGILLLTAGMFFVLPRTARAAFQRFVPQRYHLPGFSNEVTLGEIGEIKQSSTPVMHVFSQGHGFLEVRWRGAGLTHFDGKRWFNPPAYEESLRPEGRRVLLHEGLASRPGHRIGYEIRLSDVASDVLFVAGTPESMIIDVPVVWRSPAGTLHVPRINGAGLRYAVSSLLEEETSASAQLSPAERVEALELPPLDERIPRLARDMAAGSTTPEQRARALERRLRHDYGYTLELLPAPVADPLATFLFARKKGHCEYFASAMAVMLRTLGIPSRVVTGFLSGVYNPMTGWQVVRASDAHSWVEAWLPRRGWVTFDPTPPDPSPSYAGWWSRAGLVLDAADQFWQDWVVGYDFERQITLAARMQESGRQLRFSWLGDAAAGIETGMSAARAYTVQVLILFAVAALAILYGPSLVRKLRADLRVRRAQRGEAQASDATLLYERMLRVLERRGMQKPPWLTPAEFARVLPASELALLVEDLTGAYNEFRFGGRSDAAPRMVRLLRRIETLESR
ncbi:MAG: transglutaminase domain protein [Bryobacterales bacterium]|nr:transglutaminase domain protein [Bryobacterales bacterium]